MSWKRMSIDEYADLERKNGLKVYEVNGLYWKEVRPFFYRPLFPFVNITPGEAKMPSYSFLNGFQHPVPSFDLANSYMNSLLFDDISNYSLEKLPYRYMRSVRKGLNSFTVKPVNNFDEFVNKGHLIYLSFYKRTNYKWANERIDKKMFIKWATFLFNFPKILILGAYRYGELCALSISYLVEDIVMYATFFSNTEFLKLKTSDLMLHIIREMAAGCEGVKCIYMGSLSSKKSINEFKIRRECKVMVESAYFRINPILHFFTKQFQKDNYKKLIGFDQKEIDSAWEKKPSIASNPFNL